MGRFRQDLSYGFRSLLRQPGFTLVAVLTLALGIGANAAVVSFALPMLSPSLPHYEDPDRLVMLQRWRESNQADATPTIAYPLFVEWQKRNQTCLELSILHQTTRTLAGREGDPERVRGLLVSSDLVSTLGIKPYMGRGFVPADDLRGAGRTVMISYELWQRRFGGAREIVDQLITLDNLPYTVVGILPPGLSSENINGRPVGSVWLPINLFYDQLGLGNLTRAPDYTPICRLKPGVSLSAARQDITRIDRAIAEDFAEIDDAREIRLVPLRELETASFRPMLLALLAGAVLLLFIACTNLVNLFLSRFVGRQQEFAVRLALGADRGGLITLVLAEALALALMASLLGLIAAYFVVRGLPPLLGDIPYAEQADVSPAVFGYTALLCLVATLVIGLVPALRTMSPSWRQLLTPSLGSRSFPAHGGLRQCLILSEFTLALVLVTGTGLALVSFLNMRGVDRGFSTRQILSLELDLPLPEYEDVAKWTTFFDRILSVTAKLPGVKAVGLLSDTPKGVNAARAPLFADDRAIPPRGERPLTLFYTVSPDAFQVLEVPLVEGRSFVPEDNEDSGWVLVISRSVAELFWPGESAVGRKFAFEGWGDIHNPTIRWREVVGVVEDVRLRSLTDPPHHSVFVPYTQRPYYRDGRPLPMTLLLKTEVEPASMTATVRSEVLKLDPNQPIDNVRTFEEYIDEDLRPAQTVLVLFSLIAALALTLALGGIYGVMSYLIAARKRDVGIRMALGAGSPQVLAHLLRQNLVSIVIGTVLGWIATAMAVRLAAHLLYDVEPFDPAVYIASTLLLVTVALLATAIPAIRATRMDPALLLHEE